MSQEVSTPKLKVASVIKDKAQVFIIIFLSLIYIIHGLFSFEESEKTILEIIGEIAWSATVGIVITSMFTSQGLKDGRNTELFKSSLKVYADAKTKATPYFDKLATWCSYKNTHDLEIKKKEMLESVGINYRAYLTGFYDAHPEKLNEDQVKVLNNVKKCTILRITQRELLSDMPRNQYSELHRFGETVFEYKSKNLVMDVLTRLLVAVACGLYTLEPVKSADWAGLFWNLLQIIIWLSLGIFKYNSSKYFMEYEYRQSHLVQKTELFNEFVVTMEKNPDVIYTYDVNIEEEVNKFLLEKETQNGEPINETTIDR